MTYKEVYNEIAAKIDHEMNPVDTVAAVFRIYSELISEYVTNPENAGKTFPLPNVGRFHLRDKAAVQNWFNPKTRVVQALPRHRIVVFKETPNLKKIAKNNVKVVV